MKDSLSVYTSNVEKHLNELSYYKRVSDGRLATTEAEYHIYLLKIELVNRLYKDDFSALNHDPKNLVRTQDLKPLYEENSNFYIFSKESFMKTKARIGGKPFLYEMNHLESKDIDTEEDFFLTEIIHKRYF